jgi:hypothetical protein
LGLYILRVKGVLKPKPVIQRNIQQGFRVVTSGHGNGRACHIFLYMLYFIWAHMIVQIEKTYSENEKGSVKIYLTYNVQNT